MILELDDGREVKLDDSVDDDTARMLKALVQTLEKTAKAKADSPTAALKQLVTVMAAQAESSKAETAQMREALTGLAQQVKVLAGAKGEKNDDAGLRKEVAALAAAVNKMAAMKHEKGSEKNDDAAIIAALQAGFKRQEAIARAPVKWVYDATGEIVGGKKDI